MKNYSFLLASALFVFTSCLPQINVKAQNNDSATISFSTGFSSTLTKTLKNLSGLDENTPLFSKADILNLLNSSGAVNTSASLPSQNEVAASGTIPKLSENLLTKTGLLRKSEKSLTLTIGSRQIVDFYNLLNEDSKSYLDLLMIPALIGEQMSVSEYQELLSSMYGPSFAEEIVNGRLSIILSSPDGKKQAKESVTLGELLCTTEEKSWKVSW